MPPSLELAEQILDAKREMSREHDKKRGFHLLHPDKEQHPAIFQARKGVEEKAHRQLSYFVQIITLPAKSLGVDLAVLEADIYVHGQIIQHKVSTPTLGYYFGIAGQEREILKEAAHATGDTYMDDVEAANTNNVAKEQT